MAATLGLVYFVQQQRIRELDLFHRLFREFNERYDALNDRLQEVLLKKGKLSSEDRHLLTDYFNLSAEEYFYYSRGVIPSVVWKAWSRGMLTYLADPRIATLWESEASTGSYYGLTRENLLDGAGADFAATVDIPARGVAHVA